MVIKKYSSIRDRPVFQLLIYSFTNDRFTAFGATLFNGFLQFAEDTIEYPAYFAPPLVANVYSKKVGGQPLLIGLVSAPPNGTLFKK
jgi:hypothetical protein